MRPLPGAAEEAVVETVSEQRVEEAAERRAMRRTRAMAGGALGHAVRAVALVGLYQD